MTAAALIGSEKYELNHFEILYIRKSIARMNPTKLVPVLAALEIFGSCTGASL